MIHLSGFYKEDVIKCLKKRKQFIIYDSNLVVSNVIVGILERIFENQKSALFTVIVPPDEIDKTIHELSNSLTDINITSLGEFKNTFKSLTIIVSDFDTYFSYDNMKYMFKYKKLLAGIMLHCYNGRFNLSDKQTERFSFYVSSMPFAFMFSDDNFVKTYKDITLSLLHILFKGKYHTKKYYRSKIDEDKLNECSEEIIIRGRQYYPIINDFNIYIDMVNPTKEQIGFKDKNVFDVTRGINAKIQLAYLVKVLEKYKNKTGIIFFNNENHAKDMFKYFKSRKYNCFLALKSDKSYEIAHEKKQLRLSEGRFLITNITDLSDVYFDYITFYEYAKGVESILSKDERKYFPNKVDVRFLVTKNTSEPSILYNDIYNNNYMCKLLFGDKISIVKDAIID